jgi:arylsulfatase A-like enzyme
MRSDTADGTRRLRLARRALVGLAAVIARPPLALHAFHGWRHDLRRIFDELDPLGSRAADLAARARGFDREQALRALGPSRINGFTYRFDDRLGEAVSDAPEAARVPLEPLLSIELEPGEPVTLDAAHGACTVQGGTLRMEYREGDSLATRGDLAIDARAVGEIELRMRSQRGREIAIGWTSGGELLNELALSLFPVRGEPFTYRVRGEHLFHNLMREEEEGADPTIRRLTLRPSDVPGDQVEIESLRLISKLAKYTAEVAGTTYETAGREMRRVVYLNTPAALAFAVALPSERAWLETGMGVLERMHSIVLLEDAFRADRMSSAGYWRPTTPSKDEGAESGALFERAFSQETKTRPSCPALMTSLHPSATGVWSFSDVLDDRYVPRAEVMRSQGFEAAAFVQNPNACPGAGLNQGFSAVFEQASAGSRTEDLHAAALAWIEAHRERNLFVYVHVLDPHAPYDPPPPFDAWYREIAPGKEPVTRIHYFDPDWVGGESQEGRQALYAGEIAHNDHCFAAFRARLRELDLERDTLLAYISDHGEFLGEHGRWDHEPPGFAPVIRVPMAIAFPGRIPAGVRVAAPVQLIDVFPTVLELAGFRADPLLVQGRSPAPLMRGEDAERWRDRAVAPDEMIGRDNKDDGRELGSVIWRGWHCLHSAELEARSSLPGFATLRAFVLDRDPTERACASSLYFDLLVKRRLQGAVGALQRANVRIWLGLTGGVGGTMAYDPGAVEAIERLGYL